MLAQLVEQRTFNPLVGGSSPPRPTKNKKIKSLALPGFFASTTNDWDALQICQTSIRLASTFHRIACI